MLKCIFKYVNIVNPHKEDLMDISKVIAVGRVFVLKKRKIRLSGLAR